jgi:hypothetical protein
MPALTPPLSTSQTSQRERCKSNLSNVSNISEAPTDSARRKVREGPQPKADVAAGFAEGRLTTAAELMRQIAARPQQTAGSEIDELDAIKNKVRGVTANGVQSEGMLAEIAEAVVSKRYPRNRFSELLNTTNQQRLRGLIKTTPAYYFLTTFQRLARQFGADLKHPGWKSLDDYRAKAALGKPK